MITDDQRNPDFDGGGDQAEAEEQIAIEEHIDSLREKQRGSLIKLQSGIENYSRSDWRGEIAHILWLEQQIFETNQPLPND